MSVDVALIVVAYLIGSIATAVIVSRLMGLPDPRTEGSRNPGATNVLRLGSRAGAAIVLVGDALKGLVPVLAAKSLAVAPSTIALVGLAAFLGHLYPLYFGFRGGKGVATAFGVWIGLSWQVGLACVATWLVMAALFRISSVAALTTAVLAPLYLGLLLEQQVYLVMGLVLSMTLIWRHRSNIRNLLAGREHRIGRAS